MSIAPRPGTVLAGYELQEVLGRGGMGVVYRALQLGLGRSVALKLLAPELAEDESFRARFLLESRLAASIDHPSIIPVYEAGEQDGLLYLAMRLVEGEDLGALLARGGRLAPERTLALLGQVGSALDAAHAQGLVHRDVKPANMLIAGGRHVYLSDFGLSKQASLVSGATATGQLLGTLAYIAPERIEGKPLDGRSDLYAALMRHGGTKRWAREFRLPHRPQQGGSRREAEPYKWTHARLRTELEEFMGERADWPSPTEFRDAGREDLYAAVLRHGGVDRWAAALGLRLLSGRSRSPYSTHRALRDAREVIAAEGRLPNQKRLSELGFSRLGTAVAQAGGAGAFCRQHGLPVPRGG